MRGVVWDGRELIVAEDLRVRWPGPGEVVVEVLASGICQSDLHVLDGHTHHQLPIVVGHEAAGVIARVGPGVTGHKPGERVLVISPTPCRRCDAGLSAAFHRVPGGVRRAAATVRVAW